MRTTILIALTLALTAATTPALACSQERGIDTYEFSTDMMIPCITVSMKDGWGDDELSFTYTCAQGDPAVTLDVEGGMFTVDAQTAEAKLLLTQETYADDYDLSTRSWPPQMVAISWTQGEQSGDVTLTYVRTLGQRGGGNCPDEGDGIFCAATSPQRPVAPFTPLLPMLLGALLWRRRTSP
jgi:hypothetical protein